jgi:hypothetical protein
MTTIPSSSPFRAAVVEINDYNSGAQTYTVQTAGSDLYDDVPPSKMILLGSLSQRMVAAYGVDLGFGGRVS